jgi:hypothetical protein
MMHEERGHAGDWLVCGLDPCAATAAALLTSLTEEDAGADQRATG